MKRAPPGAAVTACASGADSFRTKLARSGSICSTNSGGQRMYALPVTSHQRDAPQTRHPTIVSPPIVCGNFRLLPHCCCGCCACCEAGAASVGGASVGAVSVGVASVGAVSVGAATVGGATVGAVLVGAVFVGAASPARPTSYHDASGILSHWQCVGRGCIGRQCITCARDLVSMILPSVIL